MEVGEKKLEARRGEQVPKARRLRKGSIQLVRVHTRFGTANFAPLCKFQSNILPILPPYRTSQLQLTLSFVGRIRFKKSQQVNLLWGRILHFSSPRIPPQTYMSRNRELRHDTLMFLSGDALCSHRKGGRLGRRGRHRKRRKESLRSSCGNSYSVYVSLSPEINPAGLPTQTQQHLFICMSCL